MRIDGQIVTEGDMIVEKVQVVVWKEELGYYFYQYFCLFFRIFLLDPFIHRSTFNLRDTMFNTLIKNLCHQNNRLVLQQYEDK